MPIFIGKIFAAREVSRTLKSLLCEKCGTKFQYEMARIGEGREALRT